MSRTVKATIAALLGYSIFGFSLINFAVNHISAFGVSWQKKEQES